MLGCLEDSEDLKVGTSEVEETAGNAGRNMVFSVVQVAQQAGNEKGQKIFEIFRQGEEEARIASVARWDTQLKRFGGSGKAMS